MANEATAEYYTRQTELNKKKYQTDYDQYLKDLATKFGISQQNSSGVNRNSDGQPILDANVDRVTISKAETSLVLWYLNDGSTILLPAYLLSETEASDSRQWLQLSIADKYVDFS